MIVTRKQLTEVEEAVGHSCEVGVLNGNNPGDIAIRVWAEMPDGQTYSCQQNFTRKAYLNNEWDSVFEYFKHWAKRDFDKSFAETKKVGG